MSHSIVISFEVPDELVNVPLSNERYDKENEFISKIMEHVKERIHIPSLIMQGERGISIIFDETKIGAIKLILN